VVPVAANDRVRVAPLPCFWTDAEVPEKVQEVVRFDDAIQPFDDCPIHLLDRVERTTTIPDDVLVPEMKIRSEPDVGHRGSFSQPGSEELGRWGSQRPSERSIRETPWARSSSDLRPDSGDQPPVHTKTTPVPADDGFGRDDDEGLLPSRPDPPSDYPEELIEEAETRARMSTLQRDELLTQSENQYKAMSS